jgi:hypothetical protein
VHPHAHDPELQQQARLRRIRRRAAPALALLVALIAAAGALAWFMASREPAWWARTLVPDAPARATALENGSVSVFSTPRPPGERWTAAINEEDANAWLAARLPQWLAAQTPPLRWPAEVERVGVSFRDGGVLLGAAVRQGKQSQVLSLRLVPSVGADGELRVAATSFRVGRLALPPGLVLSATGRPNPLGSAILAESDLPAGLREWPEADAVARALLEGLPLVKRPRFGLGDGRSVRLRGVEARDGRLLLTCTTDAAR